MKKLYLVIIAFFLTCSISFAQMDNDAESIIPSDVQIFIKTKEIAKLNKTSNYMLNNLMDDNQRKEYNAKKDEFKKNTGIDYLDERSLRDAGIDTGRSVSFASFDKDNFAGVYLILIPVLNEEEAVLRFIEVFKRRNPDNFSPDFKPMTAKYKNLTVYELKNDIYVTSAYKFLIIGSTSEIIKKVIDTQAARKGTLILDENYKDFLARIGDRYDLNVFLTKRFLTSVIGDDPSFKDAVDYISIGMGLDNNKFLINGSV
ncbi:MAG: DUF3352 domain-containing protein, partial [Leptospirales bacterium]|nr:DUF3352 domain-containing protein [Leptospirales bacterium]